MKTLIAGAGAAGIIAAISQHNKHPLDEILVVDHLDKPLKKLLATGNGKCNLGNSSVTANDYNNPQFVEPILNEYGYVQQKQFFYNCGIVTKLVGNLEYPITESAVTVKERLLAIANESNIKILLNTKIKDYTAKGKHIEVHTSNGTIIADKLIIATGGCSTPNLGSDGSMFDILAKHGYKVVKPAPGLCPIDVKNNLKLLDGTRVKAKVLLLKNQAVIHEESGEVLFRPKGLSGIVSFNTSNYINQDNLEGYKIVLDILEDQTEKFVNRFVERNGEEVSLTTFLHPNVANYFKKNNLKTIDAKHLVFDVKGLNGFEHSQVTVGGISLDNVKPNLESVKEKNVFFVGEVLDIHGPCGGYNLTWAFGSALFLE